MGRGRRPRIDATSTPTVAMFILRFIFKSAGIWIVTRLLGRFFPVLRRLLRVLLP